MTILLLEDDTLLGEIMYEHLEDLGFDVTHASEGEEALALIDARKFDLFILDINVPKLSGLEVLERARAFHVQTPAIMITAYQDTKHLRLGFDAGASDYMKKPFDLDELEERIKNIAKRYNLVDDAIVIEENIVFDPVKQMVKNENLEIHLSLKESQILHFFVKNKSRDIPKEELLHHIWDYDTLPSDATVRSYLKNLRKAIGDAHIITLRGFGYRFE